MKKVEKVEEELHPFLTAPIALSLSLSLSDTTAHSLSLPGHAYSLSLPHSLALVWKKFMTALKHSSEVQRSISRSTSASLTA